MRKVCRKDQPGCSIGLGTARRACDAFLSTSTALRSSSITNAIPAVCPESDEIATQQTDDEEDGCSDACVGHTLRDCFGDCIEACEGNEQALKLCRTACRNRHCELIELVCGCEPDIDCEPNPVTTTTSSTTVTTTSTTTTTLFF
jgi:hypothetical protein